MRIRAWVMAGKGLGKTLGYPTANLDCRLGNLFTGVYACHVFLHRHSQNGLIIFKHGTKPEAHLLDWNGELTGEEIEVEILDRISEAENISDQEKLVEKIRDDIRKARDYFAATKSPSFAKGESPS